MSKTNFNLSSTAILSAQIKKYTIYFDETFPNMHIVLEERKSQAP